jgi:hypothetical protein
MERGHPVRLSAKREQPLNEDTMRVSVLRTLADRMSALHHRTRYQRPSVNDTSPNRLRET